MSHSPGPWRVGDAGHAVFGPKREDKQPAEVIADKVNRKNASVIAAAPELLKACQRLLRAIEWSATSDRMDSQEQADLLRAAIKRAGA